MADTQAEEPTKVVTCPACAGKGKVNAARQTFFDMLFDGYLEQGYAVMVPCSFCEGRGKVQIVE